MAAPAPRGERVDFGPELDVPLAAGFFSPGIVARKLWCELHVEHSTRFGTAPTIAMMR
jgi:hypothetical protein